MKEIKENTYKGTRILLGNQKRDLISKMVNILISEDFEEIQIPNIQYSEMFKGKVGEENQHMMFTFKDKGNRDICLAPEYTAVIQKLASTTFKYQKNVKLFYVQECFRGEKPQKGRYRQFTQLGVEILNPTINFLEPGYNLQQLALNLLPGNQTDYILDNNAIRGLDYYKEGRGFEIRDKKGLQICGGGEYAGGVGFAIGIDRII